MKRAISIAIEIWTIDNNVCYWIYCLFTNILGTDYHLTIIYSQSFSTKRQNKFQNCLWFIFNLTTMFLLIEDLSLHVVKIESHFLTKLSALWTCWSLFMFARIAIYPLCFFVSSNGPWSFTLSFLILRYDKVTFQHVQRKDNFGKETLLDGTKKQGKYCTWSKN